MKIAVIAPTAVRIPVTNYGGIELACQWQAQELVRRGHEVLLLGNVKDGPDPAGWTGVSMATENSVFEEGPYAQLMACDAVSDWSHTKPFGMSRHPHYVGTTMWTDRQAGLGRDVYPSEAVRDAFKDPKGRVIPIGMPLDDVAVGDLTYWAPGPYVALGRIAPYKGQDMAVRVAQAVGVQLTVAGHTGAYADKYYALAIAKMCRDAGFPFRADPPDLNALLDGSPGLLHLHRWNESFSIVAAQALLRGVPILTTDVGAPQEWVRETAGGMIVRLKDLTEGRFDMPEVRAFFEMNWSSRHLGIAKRARELFDIRRVTDEYLALWGAK